MGEIRIDFTFDYVDPGSYLANHLLDRWAREWAGPMTVRWRPLEIRTPAATHLDPSAPEWMALTAEMVRVAAEEDVPFATPAFVPWTRKAHELALHARGKGRFEAVHRTIFESYFTRGQDIGRVDVLVEIAESEGLSAAETRTVLGVDRFAPEVERCRKETLEAGIGGIPTLEARGRRLQGFRETEQFFAFLREACDGAIGEDGP